MGANVLQFGCTIQCPHGGTVVAVPSQSKVLLNNQPALLPSDPTTVAGCTFTLPGPKPQPCVTVAWSGEATKMKVNNTGVLLQTSVGLCKSADGIVQGPATVSGVQTKVSAQ